MICQKHRPSFPLSKYVDSILYIQGNNKGTGLPKTAMSLVFNLEDSFKLYTGKEFIEYVDYEKFWVAGLQTKPSNVESYGVSKMRVVQFRALGAFVFLNDPLHYYTNKYVELDCVFSKEADEIWEQLQEATSLQEKYLIVENFMYRKFLMNKAPDEKMYAMLSILLDGRQNKSINEICKNQNVSRKHLNFISKKYTGVSPKSLLSLYRLQFTLKVLSSPSLQKLTNVAYESNYFDQAHFINNFKKYTDLKPSEYVKLVRATRSMKSVPHFIPY